MTSPGSFRLFGSLGYSGLDFNWVSKSRAAALIYAESFFGTSATRPISGNLAKGFAAMKVASTAKVTGSPGVLTRIYLDPYDAGTGQSGTIQMPAGVVEFTVEAVGAAGFHNLDGTATGNRWGGGAGGSYAKTTRVPSAAGTIYNYTVGIAGSGIYSTLTKQDGTVLVQAAPGGDANGLTGGVPNANNIGDLVNLGGAGGNSQAGSGAGGGGGGAGGPNGPGGSGALSHSSGNKGGGGGAANGGGNGSQGNNSSTISGIGGTARDGTAGGNIGANLAAANGSGGSGAYGTTYDSRTAGSVDVIWEGNRGIGSGAGGTASGGTATAPFGGFGGGSGGAADSSNQAGRGVIVISYYAPAAGISGRTNASFLAMGVGSLGRLQIKANAGPSFGAMIGAAAARVPVQATVVRSFAPMTLTSSAKLQIKGATTASFSAMTGAAHGGSIVGGRTNASFGTMTLTSAGRLQIKAASNARFQAMTGAAGARLPVAAKVSCGFLPLTAASTARVQVRGLIAATFAPMSAVAKGLIWIRGVMTASFLPMSLKSKGIVKLSSTPPLRRTVTAQNASRNIVAANLSRIVKAQP